MFGINCKKVCQLLDICINYHPPTRLSLTWAKLAESQGTTKTLVTPLAARFSLHASHRDLFNSTATTRLMSGIRESKERERELEGYSRMCQTVCSRMCERRCEGVERACVVPCKGCDCYGVVTVATV